ncbi:hypothetical protein QAD02_015294 [Eretmocerus hayati]|uniref:Uncharacterized protein n=1 Tax=Eretmocerus hayati TaxID=131215 RepID=A0ACC2P890_9HYME|nr:hypothetical protein QAD02_015294 [Eretmocerus hayati]
MRISIVFLALLAFTAATPLNQYGVDPLLLQKQQDVIYLLENIAGQLPNQQLYEIGMNYQFEPYLQNYENPAVVKYYVGLVKTGHVQPQGLPYSNSVSVLRKEAALLSQILIGAKDYQTFLNTAAWARVHVNQEQFVKAFAGAVLQRHDMQGIILPPVYEVFPQYFFDSRIIQKVQNYMLTHGLDYQSSGGQGYPAYHINVNYTSSLPYGENQIAYLTEDIGLNAYYSYVYLSSYMMPYGQHAQGAYQQGGESIYSKVGHGAHYYYLHQQLLARYNLERLGQGLEPIKELDNYWEHIETPYNPYLTHLNGAAMPSRGEHIYVTARHHNYELIKLIRMLEQRILDAIHSGHVITPQGAFLSLYEPQGINILGELIEGTGRSINPRYYGSFQAISKQLLGNVPVFNNIYEYNPSSLELGYTALRDPIFWQLYSKIMEFFHYYQEALPAYQYNDIVVPGVKIEQVEVGDLVTYFSDYEADVSNAVPLPVGGKHAQQPYPTVMAHMKVLNHKPYEYKIHVSAQKPVTGAVVRVYVGPKYNYDGQPIDINVHRHYFFELDQFAYDITEGHNVIIRNSRQATGFSGDMPSIHNIMKHMEEAKMSQSPHYVKPQEIYGFPARLALPKGTQNGYQLQWFVVITSGVHHQAEHYGPVVEEEWMTYQPHHYQVVDAQSYGQMNANPIDKVHGVYQTVEVIPDYDNQIITGGNWHWGYLYKKYPASYYFPHWLRTYKIHSAQEYESVGGMKSQVNSYPYSSLSMNTPMNKPVNTPMNKLVNTPMNTPMNTYTSESVLGHGGVAQPVVQINKMNQAYGQGWNRQAIYNQGMQPGVSPVTSGHYATGSGYEYPTGSMSSGSYQTSEQYLNNYYNNKYIGDIIGGAVSLDGKPLGYPLDRQLAHSAFYAPNIYVQDVAVYHQSQSVSQWDEYKSL